MSFTLTYLAIAAGLLVLSAIFKLLTSPLRSIPGPFIARFTNLWYLYRVHKGQFHYDNIELHKKYGPIVRIAPNQYSFSDPEVIKAFYGLGTEFDKAPFYAAWSPPHTPSLFTQQNNKIHSQDRRKFQGTYTMSSMVTYEAFVDDCVKLFCERLDEMASPSSRKLFDMGWGFLCYAADTVGLITFSKRMGFLDKLEDQGQLIATLHSSFEYAAHVGIYNSIHIPLFNTLAWLANVGLMKHSRKTLQNFCVARMTERKQERAEGKPSAAAEEDDTAPKGFLDKWLDAQAKEPGVMTDRDVMVGLNANVIAGADTTGGALSGILYLLLKHPGRLAKLRQDIDDAWGKGELSSPVTFAQAQKMSYLQAVIQESLRVSPPSGMPLVRIVPQGGAHFAGYVFPEGTLVGVNAWAMHYDTSNFGEDAAEFRPERWLEADKERHAFMQRMWVPFGLGSRNCIGKNISMLEMCKVLPEMLRRFEFKLSPALQEHSWKLKNRFLVMPVDFELTIDRREVSQG